MILKEGRFNSDLLKTIIINLSKKSCFVKLRHAAIGSKYG